MSANSAIQWTDATWNPTAGCSLVSPGCTNCYAMRDAWRLAHNPNPKIQAKYAGTVEKVNGKAVWTGKVNLDEEALLAPLAWRKPRRVFVDSMSDLFHEDVPVEFIDRVSAVQALTPHITYQVLTKRGERMRTYYQRGRPETIDFLTRLKALGGIADRAVWRALDSIAADALLRWPLPNVWLGVSVEDRARKRRIDELRATPAAVRFLSLEPLLEDLGEIDLAGIDWVICGGESGPRARAFDIAWARALMAQCAAAQVPFFMKQLGARPHDGARRFLCGDRHGGNPEQWPADLRVRQFPSVSEASDGGSKSG